MLADIASRIDYTCGSLSTVFVTVPAPPVTKTVTIPDEIPSATVSGNVLPIKLSIPSDSLTNITTTLTEYITYLHLVSTVQAIPTSDVASQDHYTFTEHHGTTIWFDGKKPPAGIPLVTSTATVTIQPVPLNSGVSTGGNAEPTSYLTVLLTVVKHEKVALTKTVSVATTSDTAAISSTASASSATLTPLAVSVPSTATASSIATTSTKIFRGHRLNGWNTTFTAVPKEKAAKSVTEPVKPFHHQPNAKENHAARPGIASPAAASYPNNATKHLEARQLGAIVVATIAGVVVSWTNNYDGGAATTPAPATIETHAASQEDPAVTSELLRMRSTFLVLTNNLSSTCEN